MKKYFGTREFYKTVIALLLPMLLQNTISSFVNLLDNLMVGRTGTEQMSGVSIVNQVMFIYNLAIFGGTSGAGIFAAQFYGKGDENGVRHCLRFNYIVVGVFSLLAVVILSLFGTPLISLFLTDDGQADLVETLLQAQGYLKIMLFGIAPFAITNAYAGILRSCGAADIPMKAGILAVVANMVGNYILIFGHFGFPVLGVRGAAIATVISRYLEAAMLLIVSRKRKLSYTMNILRDFRIPKPLFRSVLKGSLPLLCNELFWSLGETTITQSYSLRGITAIAAFNIANVVMMVCSNIQHTLGNCVGIVLGNELGAGDFDKAREDCPRLMMTALLTSFITVALMCVIAPLVPRFYNTGDTVRQTATQLVLASALFQPFGSLANASYFAIRSGGRTLLTVLSDSCFNWVVVVPTCYLLIHFTDMSLVQAYMCVNCTMILKTAFGIYLLKKGVWIQNIVSD